MRIIEPSVEFITATPDIGKIIELGARNCYKSEDKIGDGSDEKLFNQIVKQFHHESVVEHGSITVRIITDRAMLAQITRHRHFSFSVESQRYNNYSKGKFGGEVTYIKPHELKFGTNPYKMWEMACGLSEEYYFKLIQLKTKPEVARSVLPNSTKTEIIMTGNVRSWRHFFSLRSSGHAQKDVQQLSQMVYASMIENNVPAYLFDDIIHAEE